MASVNSFESQFDSLGFVPGSVRGARAFVIAANGDLTGIFYPQVWRLGVNTAECMKHKARAWMPFPSVTYYQSTPVDVPTVVVPPDLEPHLMDTCRHGFYGYYDGSNDFNNHYMTRDGCAQAVVEGYGEVMIGTRGFRAMKARIVALAVTQVTVRTREQYELMLRKYADVPFFDTFERMVSAFPLGEV